MRDERICQDAVLRRPPTPNTERSKMPASAFSFGGRGEDMAGNRANYGPQNIREHRWMCIVLFLRF